MPPPLSFTAVRTEDYRYSLYEDYDFKKIDRIQKGVLSYVEEHTIQLIVVSFGCNQYQADTTFSRTPAKPKCPACAPHYCGEISVGIHEN